MRTMATTVLTAVLVGAALVGAGLAGPACAQTSSAPSQTFSPSTTDGQSTVPEAPVGHRQPTIQDLPAAVRRDERGDVSTPYQRKLDQEMQICRGC